MATPGNEHPLTLNISQHRINWSVVASHPLNSNLSSTKSFVSFIQNLLGYLVDNSLPSGNSVIQLVSNFSTEGLLHWRGKRTRKSCMGFSPLQCGSNTCHLIAHLLNVWSIARRWRGMFLQQSGKRKILDIGNTGNVYQTSHLSSGYLSNLVSGVAVRVIIKCFNHYYHFFRTSL